MCTAKRALFLLAALLMAAALCVSPSPMPARAGGASAVSLKRPSTSSETLDASLATAKAYIDALTINSTVNVPKTVVENTSLFFSWDHEQRASPSKPYLYEWSYYNGVVFEGIEDVYAATGTAAYQTYANAYLDAMVTSGALNSYAGYVSYHGLDCYKTASMLLDYGNSEYEQVAGTLYNDLTVTNAQYSITSLGYNYWHSWTDGDGVADPPAYKVWLDGIYMGQPFLAEYADHAGDSAQLDKVAARLDWVHDNMRSSTTGLFYHGANSSTDHVNFHWLRAIGWYAMAQVNVMPHMSGGNLTTLEGDFKDFVDGMLPYQDATTGMWKNLVDQAYSASGSNINRYETSGTAMMSYAILRAVRNGWLEDVDGTYTDAAIKAFEGIVNNKLVGGELIDTYFKGSASGSDNYHTASYYYADEGKGVGPFIMAYAEALQVEAPTGTIGGVNGDGTVDSTDALIVLSADAGIDTSQFCPMNCGDVNADGLVNSTDALILLSYDVGMTVPFPVGQPGCPPSVTQPAGCTP